MNQSVNHSAKDHTAENIDVAEQQQFARLASRWWDMQGEFQALHDVNPARLAYVTSRCELGGQRALDVGCGGGILAESLAASGAEVTGIDVTREVLEVARLHLMESGQQVNYRQITVEQLAAEHTNEFPVITCMEMLEHVPDPASIVAACAKLLKPGGQLFFSTLNRSPLSFALGIVAAEYVLNLVPRGTHRYDRFIRPSELADWCRKAGLAVQDISALHYNPITREARVGGAPRVNYLLHAQLDQ